MFVTYERHVRSWHFGGCLCPLSRLYSFLFIIQALNHRKIVRQSIRFRSENCLGIRIPYDLVEIFLNDRDSVAHYKFICNQIYEFTTNLIESLLF